MFTHALKKYSFLCLLHLRTDHVWIFSIVGYPRSAATSNVNTQLMRRMEVALLLPGGVPSQPQLSPTPSQSLKPYRAQISMQKQTGTLVGLGHDSDTTPKGISETSKEEDVKRRQLMQNENHSQTCKVDLLLIHNLKGVISLSCPYCDTHYAGWVLRLGSRSRI